MKKGLLFFWMWFCVHAVVAARFDSVLSQYNDALYQDAVHSLELAHELVTLAQKEQDDSLQGLAQVAVSGAYWLMADYVSSKRELLKALDYYESTGSKMGLAQAYQLLAIIDIDLGRFAESVQYNHRAIRFDPKDSFHLSNCYLNMGIAFLKLEELDSAGFYFKHSLDINKQIGDSARMVLNFHNNAALLLAEGEDEKALQQARLSQRLARKYGDRKNDCHAGIISARALLNLDRTLDALREAEEVRRKSLEYRFPETVRDAWGIIHQAHEFLGHEQEAAGAESAYVKLNDSLINVKNVAQIADMELQYERERSARNLAEADLEQQRQRTLFIVFIALALLVAAVALTLFMRYRLLERNRSTELALAEERQRTMKTEIEDRERELLSYTLMMSQRNVSLQEIIYDLEGEQKHSRVQHKLKKVGSIENDWTEFKQRFEQVHPDFFKRLHQLHPKLTQKEHRLAALLLLNLNSKQISELLGISSKSVDMARYRLRKKLRLPADASLYEYLISI